MPPARRENAEFCPMTSRGNRYFSCASSTCSLPSLLCARWANMSRISCGRSMTFRSVASDNDADLRRRKLGVEDDHVRTEPHRADQQLIQLTLTEHGLRIDLRTALNDLVENYNVGRYCQFFEFGHRFFGVFDVAGRHADQDRSVAFAVGFRAVCRIRAISASERRDEGHKIGIELGRDIRFEKFVVACRPFLTASSLDYFQPPAYAGGSDLFRRRAADAPNRPCPATPSFCRLG